MARKRCSQCGKPFYARACGPTHEAIEAGTHSVYGVFTPTVHAQLSRAD